MAESSPRPTTIVIAALGGQGGGVLSSWIVDVAEHAGFLAQATSVPGVAQRTGTTIYYLELFPEEAATAAGRDPVLALMPVPGEVDIVVVSELVEAGRTVLRGLVTPERTTVITSSHREYSVVEKAVMGDGIVDASGVRAAVEEAAKACVVFDMAALAESTSSVISSVMFGALAGTGVLPFQREQYEQTITRSGIAVDRSLTGFAAGYAGAVGERDADAADEPPLMVVPVAVEAEALLARVEATFPVPARERIIDGMRRLADYQDLRYAAAYLDRLDGIRELDGGGEDGQYRLTAETARYLALWMSYEDAIRVADLKTRSARFERFRKEVGADPEQLVYVVEYLHPRVEEICDILPAPLGGFVMRRDGLRKLLDKVVSRGRHVPTAKLGGFLLLYMIAGLRRWRRWSYRHGREMALIDSWLGRITASASADYALAVEIARCQRLIKGYGDTHANGMKNFNAIMNVVDRIDHGANASDRIGALRDAALADEDGRALRDAISVIFE
ncbi:MAG: indolepyruvate oxidoreductase subunit beta family protein [Gemmatimonadetes bacterium]|nr:indolepyruvate oxidoreductase subunit beta family protein [Gemmatimonadota bacterium]